MNLSLNLTQEQKLIMTQEMQLSVKLLQMSNFELQEYIEKEVEENPVLEAKYEESIKENHGKEKIDYDKLIKYFEFDNYGHHSYDKDDEEVSPFNFIANKKSLKEYLKEQIRELNEKDNIENICIYLVENIDPKGYIDYSIDDIAKELKISKDMAIRCLKLVQSLEPDGIGARDLKECLKIQLTKRGIKDDIIFEIVDNYLQSIADNKYNNIAKELNIDIKMAQHYGDIIKSLEPKPSRGFYTGEEVKYIIPDAYIREIDGEFYILMNEESTPKLSINDIYKQIIQNEKDKEAIDYVKGKINNAMFLIKSIEHRKSTIYKVLEEILKKQEDYFRYGENYLKPMTLKEISEELDMHESTISRAIKEKYIYTNRGTVKIKNLFTTSISSEGNDDISTNIIKKHIRDLIDKEDKKKPMSDQNICDKLNELGMNISRRTVAKYREEMEIKSSSKRKRF